MTRKVSAVDPLDAGHGGPAHRALTLARWRCEQDGAAVSAEAQVVAGVDDVVFWVVKAHLAQRPPLVLVFEFGDPAFRPGCRHRAELDAEPGKRRPVPRQLGPAPGNGFPQTVRARLLHRAGELVVLVDVLDDTQIVGDFVVQWPRPKTCMVTAFDWDCESAFSLKTLIYTGCYWTPAGPGAREYRDYIGPKPRKHFKSMGRACPKKLSTT